MVACRNLHEENCESFTKMNEKVGKCWFRLYYLVHGQKVMLDVDLAELYGYETKSFNRQVKNNLEKIEGEDFMFQLTKEEWENLRSKNLTAKGDIYFGGS